MFEFDLTKEPLTTSELEALISSFKKTRTQQIKHSCISDVLHAFFFIGLYYGGVLGGYPILVAVAISTVVAIGMAMLKNRPSIADKVKISAVAVAAAAAVFSVLHIKMAAELVGSLLAAIPAVSIVLVGSTLGRNVKAVMTAIEDLKTIRDDEISEAEIKSLCRIYPELEAYRESATLNLRPHLTYGELNAMRRWHDKHRDT